MLDYFKPALSLYSPQERFKVGIELENVRSTSQDVTGIVHMMILKRVER